MTSALDITVIAEGLERSVRKARSREAACHRPSIVSDVRDRTGRDVNAVSHNCGG
jgi:hypothetical protein